MKKIKILDCTLRDGGYYTNWDFDRRLVDNYISSLEKLPIDYIEIGYRSEPLQEYFGEYFYSPLQRIKYLKTLMPTTGLAMMIDEKNTTVDQLHSLFAELKDICAMVRIAVGPERISNAILLSRKLKEYKFEVALNIMYVSKIVFDTAMLDTLNQGKDCVDYLYLVDSYGGISPAEISEKIKVVKEQTSFSIGFHGHNNLELALSNAIAAMDAGAEIIDSTLTGMGRGAGNLKTELLLTYLFSKQNWQIDFSYLAYILPEFENLQKQYNWGTNLPYMISGAFSLPQKDVMDWMGKRRYTINSLVQAMANYQSDTVQPKFQLLREIEHVVKFTTKALIVGGGNTVRQHISRIREYLLNHPDILIIHSSTRNVDQFLDLKNHQILCLTGHEGKKLDEKHLNISELQLLACVLPPAPRKMGAYVPPQLLEKSMEIEKIDFVNRFHDSPLSIAFQLLIDLHIDYAGLVGVDGYQQTLQRDFELREESQEIINGFIQNYHGKLEALTLTSYLGIKQNSIYAS